MILKEDEILAKLGPAAKAARQEVTSRTGSSPRIAIEARCRTNHLA